MIKTDESKLTQDKIRPVQVGLRVLEEPFSIEMRFLWSLRMHDRDRALSAGSQVTGDWGHEYTPNNGSSNVNTIVPNMVRPAVEMNLLGCVVPYRGQQMRSLFAIAAKPVPTCGARRTDRNRTTSHLL